jgi:hypothetical protein
VADCLDPGAGIGQPRTSSPDLRQASSRAHSGTATDGWRVQEHRPLMRLVSGSSICVASLGFATRARD